jgi:hypothetical protein
MWRLGVVFVWVFRQLGLVEAKSAHLLSGRVRTLLRKAEAVELFSLGGIAEERPGEARFQGALVLGSVAISRKSSQRRLLSRVLLANRYNLGGFRCLGAEYGLRIRAGEITLDLQFCFGCGQVWVYGSDGSYENASVAGYPVSLMDQLLKRAGVPLPPPMEH